MTFLFFDFPGTWTTSQNLHFLTKWLLVFCFVFLFTFVFFWAPVGRALLAGLSRPKFQVEIEEV